MLGPAGHHQAVTAASDGAYNIIDDLRGAGPVRYQRRNDDRLKDARGFAVYVLANGRCRRMNMQVLDQVCLAWDLVAHRPAVHEHDFLAAVWSFGCRREPEPASRRNGPDRRGEGLRRDVVAFIDDNEPVLRQDLRGVIGPGERL
jgi:hypothetical protein